jgi:hypothetical protein
MKTFSILFILLAAFFPSFSQLENRPVLALKVMLLQDSITGKKIEVNNTLTTGTTGRLLLEADPNDPEKEIYDSQLLIEVIHARGSSALTTISFAGLKDFARDDVLKTLRPALRPGDRIVLTYKMMSQSNPMAWVINID